MAQMWQEQLGQWRARAPVWVAIALAMVVAADALWWTRDLVSANREAAGNRAPVVGKMPARHQATDDLQEIVGMHLFGQVPPANPVEAAEAGEESRRLELDGTMATDDPQRGFAIIAERGKSGHLYAAGADLIGALRGRVYQVLKDRVIIDFSGHFEMLQLPRTVRGGGDVRVASVESEQNEVVMQVAAAPADAAPSEAQSVFDVLHAARAANGPGVQLYPEMRLQRKFGVRDGDVLLAVNGVSATDPGAVQDLLRSSPDALSLTVMRNGSRQTISIPVDD
jgi:general secretion pathway protein C